MFFVCLLFSFFFFPKVVPHGRCFPLCRWSLFVGFFFFFPEVVPNIGWMRSALEFSHMSCVNPLHCAYKITKQSTIISLYLVLVVPNIGSLLKKLRFCFGIFLLSCVGFTGPECLQIRNIAINSK
jgi:hypothetical protein